MKKLIVLTAALGLCAASALAQGTINFANSLPTVVTQTNGPSTGVGGFGAATNSTKVELFYQVGGPTAPSAILVGTAINSAWEAMSGGVFALTSNAGRFAAGAESTGSDVLPGGNVWLTVVGWSGSATTLSAALQAGGAAYVGQSTIFELGTGGGGTPPATAVNLTAAPVAGNAFAGLVLTPVPEPSVMILSGLGAAAMLLYRRKK